MVLVDDGGAWGGRYLGVVQQLLEHQSLITLISVVVHEDGGRSRVIACQLGVPERVVVDLEGRVLLTGVQWLGDTVIEQKSIIGVHVLEFIVGLIDG